MANSPEPEFRGDAGRTSLSTRKQERRNPLTTSSKSLRAQRILDELKECGVTHIVWIPDSEATFMYDAIVSEPSFTLVPVCREGECAGVATGLLLGGKQPVILHQNTGFFEAGDSLRGLGIDLRLPLVMMIGYRGYETNRP